MKESSKKCNFCGESINISLRRCPYCGSLLPKEVSKKYEGGN